MSVLIVTKEHFSKGVGSLYPTAESEAKEYRDNLISILAAGGVVPEEASRIASQCKESSAHHRFELICDQKTIMVRMTKDEFKTVKKALGMSETNPD